MSKKVKGTEFICNMCGNKFTTKNNSHDGGQVYDIKKCIDSWIYEINLTNQGYGSFLDNCKTQIHICDDCMKELFENMEVKPTIKSQYGDHKYGEQTEVEKAYERLEV